MGTQGRCQPGPGKGACAAPTRSLEAPGTLEKLSPRATRAQRKDSILQKGLCRHVRRVAPCTARYFCLSMGSVFLRVVGQSLLRCPRQEPTSGQSGVEKRPLVPGAEEVFSWDEDLKAPSKETNI